MQSLPKARLRIVTLSGQIKETQYVRLAVSNRLFWKVINDDNDSMPRSLFDFYGHNSLSFMRLASERDWSDVEDMAMAIDQDGLVS